MVEMVKIQGSLSFLGNPNEDGYPSDLEGPQILVNIRDFYIATTTVSNQDFLEFVEATGYITQAESYGDSFVFGLNGEVKGSCCSTDMEWWKLVKGACWRHPEGFGSNIHTRMNHPVVHVTYRDALAYCVWSDTRLPSELEWEYAARGGTQTVFPWGDMLIQNGTYYANTFQGDFPNNNTAEDGFSGTAPTVSFFPNNNGLYQMIGNVWEWQSHQGGIPLDNLKQYYEGNTLEVYQSYNDDTFMAARGGSFLCHESYCKRYRVAARTRFKASTSSSNLGFRVVKD